MVETVKKKERNTSLPLLKYYCFISLWVNLHGAIKPILTNVLINSFLLGCLSKKSVINSLPSYWKRKYWNTLNYHITCDDRMMFPPIKDIFNNQLRSLRSWEGHVITQNSAIKESIDFRKLVLIKWPYGMARVVQ